MLPTFYEFFAGGGMVRAGLGAGWSCLFANDFDEMKGRVYSENWGNDHLLIEDVAKVQASQLPERADLAWASFPCQDLSLAGSYAGIGHWANKELSRSGTLWPFWSLMRDLQNEDRAPRIIALENVYGILRSNKGQDFKAVASVFSGSNYRFGAAVIDAKHFVPQSRPRVFIIGVRRDIAIPDQAITESPDPTWHPSALIEAHSLLSSEAKRKWVWWNIPKPAKRNKTFSDIIQVKPEGVKWHTQDETKRLLAMMTDVNLAKVKAAQEQKKMMVGGLYRRTRVEDGKRIQRAEVRFDDIAGCLRTPSGGSSRQTILIVNGRSVKSRLLAPREAIELMGLGADYKIPKKYNDAYHVAGDGVAVPVVRHLAEHIFEPILHNNAGFSIAAE